MRQQKGYLFHKRQSWFLRHCDDVIQPDGTIERKLVCKKLPVPFGPEYPTKKSVAPFVDEILGPLNAGTTNPVSAMKITDFVEHVYFEHASQRLRASVTYGYRGLWAKHLKGRLGKQVLRDFRTVDGEQLLATIARNNKLSRNSLKHIKSFLSGVFTEAKRLGILDGTDARPDIARHAADRLEGTHVEQRIGGPERIVEVLAIVVDAREPVAGQHLIAQNLRPEILDLLTFGEEAMAADIEAIATVLDRAGNAANEVRILLDYRYWNIGAP